MRSILNNKAVLILIAILLLANIAILAFFLWFKEPAVSAQPAGSRAVIARFLEKEIGFSPRQIEQYQRLRDQHKRKMRPLFEEMRLTKIQFFALLHTPDPPDSLLSRAALLIGEKQKNIDMQAFRNFQELRTLCTAEQQRRYDSLLPGVINKMWFAPKEDSAGAKPRGRR